jgi:glyceraldehyde 3-phosphate dehydrogenase
MKIAINGMGRMGRLFLRAALNSGLDVVCCNEPMGDGEGLAIGIEFDSVQRRYQKGVRFEDGCILVGDHPVRFSQASKIEDLPWQDLGIDLVVECSGRLRRRSDCLPHLEHFAKKVLVSNPVVGAPNLVFGVNHRSIEIAEHEVITAASCTTNCLSPIVRVLHDKIGIARGAVTTLHDPTNTQVVVDRPHKDARRARSALVNLVPTSTNSATAVTEIIPELKGRLDSIAVRVPVLNASIVDCAFSMERDTDVEEVNGVLSQAAAGEMRDILGFETRPLVSSDYANDPRSGIVDALSTRCIDRRLVKLLAWYDNEWGYVNRMVDLARCVQSNM